jgi:hypothetical protein
MRYDKIQIRTSIMYGRFARLWTTILAPLLENST